MTSLLMGPLLGLEAETQYSICFLAGPGCKGASIRINGTLLPASKQADTPRGGLWRASWTASPAAEGAAVEYRILLDGEPARDLAGDDHWQFYLPGLAEPVRIGYASCNGFSDFKLLTSTPQPYVMWGRLATEHAAHPFSLLLMGGGSGLCRLPLDHGSQPQGLERAGQDGEGQTQGDPHHGGAARSLLLRSLLQAVEPARGGPPAGPGAKRHDVG